MSRRPEFCLCLWRCLLTERKRATASKNTFAESPSPSVCTAEEARLDFQPRDDNPVISTSATSHLITALSLALYSCWSPVSNPSQSPDIALSPIFIYSFIYSSFLFEPGALSLLRDSNIHLTGLVHFTPVLFEVKHAFDECLIEHVLYSRHRPRNVGKMKGYACRAFTLATSTSIKQRGGFLEYAL